MKQRVRRAVVEQNREGLDPLAIAAVFVSHAEQEPGRPLYVEIPFGGEKTEAGMILRIGKERYAIQAATPAGKKMLLECVEVANVGN